MWVAFKATHIFFSKNTCEFGTVVTRTDNILTTNEFVKLMMLWTTGSWCFMSLSTLSMSHRDNGRLIMKGSVQWSIVQSWAEFHLQQDSNQDLVIRVLTTQPPGGFSVSGKKFQPCISILVLMMMWYFISLSKLSKSNPDDKEVIMKGSVNS